MVKLAKRGAVRRAPREAAPSPNPDAVGAARQDPQFGAPERLKLPHEHDESPADLAKPGERAAHQRELVEQAQDDVERLQDADCRNPHDEDSACPPVPEIAQGPKPDKKKS
jgi:hypothetical protein